MNTVETIISGHAILIDDGVTVWAKCELTGKDGDCCMLLIDGKYYNVNRSDAIDLVNGDYPTLTHMNEREQEESFDDFLDDCYGEIDVCGLKYYASRALRLIDKTAYRQGFLDYIDALCRDGDVLVEINNEIYRKG